MPEPMQHRTLELRSGELVDAAEAHDLPPVEPEPRLRDLLPSRLTATTCAVGLILGLLLSLALRQ